MKKFLKIVAVVMLCCISFLCVGCYGHDNVTIIFSILFASSMVVMIRYITNSVKWKKYQESIKE